MSDGYWRTDVGMKETLKAAFWFAAGVLMGWLVWGMK